MNRTILAAAALAATTTANAQSSLAIYGIVSTGPEYLTNVNAQHQTLLRMPNITSLSTSKLGFRGLEDLGGGMGAFFDLEWGIAPDTGSFNGQGRMTFSYVGMQGPLGKLTFGRQNNMTVIGLYRYLLGPTIYSIASEDPYLAGAISDNTIGYLGNVGDWYAGATYALGRNAGPNGSNPTCPDGTPNNAKACSQWTAMVKYDTAPFGFAASYDDMRGGPGGVPPLTTVDDHDRRSAFSSWGTIGSFKLGGGVLKRSRTGATPLASTLSFFNFGFPLKPALSADFEVSRLDMKNSPNDTTMVVARLVYSYSSRVSVFAMVAHDWNRGKAAISVSPGATVGPGLDQTGFHTGIRYIF